MSYNSPNQGNYTLSIPRPGKAVVWLMIVLAAIWVFYAAGIESGAAGTGSFQYLAGSTRAVLRGEIWRLFTAPFLHIPAGTGATTHLLFTLIGLYFFGTPLEKSWGAKRFLAFAYGATIFGFAMQILAELIVPSMWLGAIQQTWFGANGAVQALAIAWLVETKGQGMRLFGAIPIAPKIFAAVLVGMCLFHSLLGKPSEGIVASLATILFGYLLGGETSTLRRLWLRFRLRKLQSQAKSMVREDRKFRVIEGGKGKADEGSKKWLN